MMGELQLVQVLVPEVGAISILLAFIGVGLLKWLSSSDQDSARLNEVSIKSYPRPVLLIDGGGTIIDANDAALEKLRGDEVAADDKSTTADDYVGRQLSSAFAIEDESWPNRSQDTRPISGRTVDEGIDVTLTALPGPEDSERAVWFIEVDAQGESDSIAQVRDFYEQVLDGIPIEVALLSPRGEYLYANRALTGSEGVRSWLIGRSDFDYFEKLGAHPELALRRRSHRRKVLEEKAPVRFSEEIAHPKGTIHYHRMYVPIIADSGAVEAIAFVGQNITEQKRQAREAARGREQFAQFARLKAVLLQNMSHEFRTPLTGMLGAAEVIASEAPDELAEFAQIIQDNGNRLMQTLQGMLQLGQLEGGGLELEPIVVDVRQKVEAIIDRMRPEAQRKQLYLRSRSEWRELYARADETALDQTLESLIGNAIKFTEEGGVLIEVAIADGEVTVQVMDTGIGIEQDFLPQLFQPFVQEHDGLDRTFQGAGIGLHVVNEVVGYMGGRVDVSTEKGEGSTFTVHLPLAASIEGRKCRVHLRSIDTERKKILTHLVDDYVEVHEGGEHSEGLSDIDVAICRTMDGCRDLPGQVAILLLHPDARQANAERPVDVLETPLTRRGVLQSIQDVLHQ